MASHLELDLLQQIKLCKIKEPIVEYKFSQSRRWRVDMVWLDEKLAVEVEGAIWVKGRHIRPKGFLADCEKYNELALKGFRLIRVCREHIKNGMAIDWIERGLNRDS